LKVCAVGDGLTRAQETQRTSTKSTHAQFMRSVYLQLLEMPQVRRSLVLARRHQEAVGSHEVVLSGDLDVAVAFGADRFRPDRLLLARSPAIFLDRRPRPRQRVVDGRDLKDDKVWIRLVRIKPLLDDGLVVGVQRQACSVIRTRAFEIAGL